MGDEMWILDRHDVGIHNKVKCGFIINLIYASDTCSGMV